jgi:hypothetical protein
MSATTTTSAGHTHTFSTPTDDMQQQINLIQLVVGEIRDKHFKIIADQEERIVALESTVSDLLESQKENEGQLEEILKRLDDLLVEQKTATAAAISNASASSTSYATLGGLGGSTLGQKAATAQQAQLLKMQDEHERAMKEQLKQSMHKLNAPATSAVEELRKLLGMK